jgi:GrpB-like predicted nucleotidyltransferase (UPF0157 family)
MNLFAHNPGWKLEYLAEERALRKAYGIGLTLHHIGSTAVEGLDAKDCIDILGVVGDLAEIKTRAASISDLGYQSRGEYGIEGRAYFSKSIRKVHLHIFGEGNHNIDKHLGFVHLMQTSPELRDKLNTLKRRLQCKFPNDKDLYQQGKIHFYNEVHRML